jgi:geranylgeranyl pyrophosphate synthase
MTTATVRSETMEDVLNRYEPYLRACRGKIVAGLQTTPASAVLAKYFERGKMFRAFLVFLAASATGNDPGKMIMAAAALELLHGASLIHDDIVDEADERRGLPALHLQVGIGPALVLGDYLILHSFAVLREAETVYDSSRVLGALHTLNHYARACCLGEVQERLPSIHLDPEEDYLAIVRGKTASQFAAAVTVPVILGGGTLPEIEALRKYGLNLGIAFQIHDDVLDLTGDASILGKPVGISLAQGRPMLPLIYLERYGSLAARRAAYRFLQQMEHGGRIELVAMLKEEGIFDRVTATRDKYVSGALQALDRLLPSKEIEALKVFATYGTTHRPTHTLIRMVVPQ